MYRATIKMKCKIPNRGAIIENYLDGNLSEVETEKFEEHFLGCEVCFDEIKFKQELINLIKEEGDVLFKDLIQRTPSTKKSKTITGKLINILSPKPVWIPALTVVLLVVLIAGKTPFREWRATVNAQRGLILLKNTRTIMADEFRPAGNFSLGMFSTTHSEEEAHPALKKLEAALDWNQNSQDAKLGMATFLYMNNQIDQADDLLKTLISQDSLNHQTWNMIALVSARQDKNTLALTSFDKALQINPYYPEAAYNRALFLQQQGNNKEAIEAWKTYLEIDQKSEWRNAAQNQLSSISP